MDLGPHATFILAAYALVALVLAGLALWLWLDGRQQANLIADLERRGVRRRSRSRAGTDGMGTGT
ncbi:MAG: heme exporter protein CcmD [Hyphomicrobiaceae bacterium]|nr:heme exporter protein CcmD [Hyphomicrobiaceae bacterium]